MPEAGASVRHRHAGVASAGRVAGRFGVTHVAMESMGVYGKPVWNVLEGRFALLLVNATHIKNVPGRKTDGKDCAWISVADQEIARRSREMEEADQLLDTIPGVNQVTARALVAEIGTRMQRFPTAQSGASWAGLCPGNHESAGKRLSWQPVREALWLRRVLVQVGLGD